MFYLEPEDASSKILLKVVKTARRGRMYYKITRKSFSIYCEKSAGSANTY